MLKSKFSTHIHSGLIKATNSEPQLFSAEIEFVYIIFLYLVYKNKFRKINKRAQWGQQQTRTN